MFKKDKVNNGLFRVAAPSKTLSLERDF